MASEVPVGRPNAVMVAVAVVAAASAIFNAASALLADTVWVPSLSEFTLYHLERKTEPLIFYAILGANIALAAYFCWDVWRTHRKWQQAKG